jgi:dolichol kinase
MTFNREVARKALHLMFAAVPIALTAGLSQLALVWILGAMLIVALGLELTRTRVAPVGAMFMRTVGPLLRPHETNNSNQNQHHRWTGATWLIAVCLGAVWALPRPDAIAVTWAAAAGDASAALIGIPLGGRLFPKPGASNSNKSSKSIEGSAACFLVTFVGAYGLAGLGLRLAVFVAAAATVAEWPSWGVDDNVRVGAATTAVLVIAAILGRQSGL